MDAKTYLGYLHDDATALGTAAARAPAAAVAPCPGWVAADLVAHTGQLYQWVDAIVGAGGERVTRRTLPPGPPADPEGIDRLVEWQRQTLQQMLSRLGEADPDQPAWNFGASGDHRVGFWCRRMANETAVHRWDAQSAATPGTVGPIAPELAVDGIDEYFAEFLPPKLEPGGVDGIGGSLHLHATDVTGEWWLDLTGGAVEPRREHAKADAAVRATASDLLLWLWNRVPATPDRFEVFGRRDTINGWVTITI